MQLTTEQVETVFGAAAFKFAKTMPQNPHWYTLRKTWVDQEMFDKVVQFIRDTGTAEMYGGRSYICFYSGGFKYWTMGAPIPATILINRAEVKKPALVEYDGWEM